MVISTIDVTPMVISLVFSPHVCRYLAFIYHFVVEGMPGDREVTSEN